MGAHLPLYKDEGVSIMKWTCLVYLAVAKSLHPVPDLSFSETTFLSTRRAAAAERSKETHRDNVADKIRVSNIDEEMSRFFTSNAGSLDKSYQDTAADDSRRSSHRRNPTTGQFHGRHSRVEISSLPPASFGLPRRPFLGFGEPGPYLPSNTDPPEESMVKVPPQDKSSHATSCYSWSTSPNRSVRYAAEGELNKSSPRVSPDKHIERSHQHSETLSSHLKQRLDCGGASKLQQSSQRSAETNHRQMRAEGRTAQSHSRISSQQTSPSGKSTRDQDYQTSGTSVEIGSNKVTGDSVNDYLGLAKVVSADTRDSTEGNPLRKTDFNGPLDKSDSFTEVLDTIFGKLESRAKDSNFDEISERKVSDMGIRSTSPGDREISAESKARCQSGRTPTYASHSGVTDDQSPQEENVGVCERSRVNQQKHIAASPSPLSAQGKPYQQYRPDTQLPYQLENRAWKGPITVFGQELEAVKLGWEHKRDAPENTLRISRGSSLRRSSARAYGTLVSLHLGPPDCQNIVRGHVPRTTESCIGPLSDSFGYRFSGNVSVRESEGYDCATKQEEREQTERLEMNDVFCNEVTHTYAQDHSLSSQRQNESSYSNKYSLESRNLPTITSRGYSRTGLGSQHSTVTPSVLRYREDEQHLQRGVITQQQQLLIDSEPGLLGFWKPNKLY